MKTEISRRHFNQKADDIYEADREFIYELRDPVKLSEERDFGFIRYAIIMELVEKISSSGSHLDLGCGSGYLMAKVAQAGYTASGVDLSRRFLDIAREKLKHYRLNFDQLIEADLQESLPLADNKFDLITSSDVIEHLEKPERMLAEAYRLLKNGGYLIVSTNNIVSAWGLVKLVSEKILRRPGYHPVDNWVTAGDLAGLVRRAGFKVIALRGAYFFPYYRLKTVLERLGLYERRTRINSWLSRSIFKYFGRDLIILLRKERTQHSFWYDPHTGLRRNHTVWRLMNRAGVELGIKLKNPYAFAWPHYAVIETNNTCNLRCPLCPTGQGIAGRPKGSMRFDDFRKIIDTIGIYLYSVRLENWGEPLLNDDIVSMVEYLKKNGIASAFNTNLLRLNELLAQRLVIAGLGHIKISFDGVDQESYSRYRQGGDFHLLMDNIECLVRKRKALGRKNPFIELQYLVMRHNEPYVKKAREIGAKLGVDRFSATPLRLDMRDEILRSDEENFQRHKEWLPQNPDYSDIDYSSGRKKDRSNFCDYLWDTVVINYDGSVVPCCSAYDPKYDFGNFFNEGFARIWNGPKYRAARGLIGRGIPSPVQVICQRCLDSSNM